MTEDSLRYRTRIAEAKRLVRDFPENIQVYAFFDRDRIELFNEEQILAELRKYLKISSKERVSFVSRVFALRSQRELKQSA